MFAVDVIDEQRQRRVQTRMQVGRLSRYLGQLFGRGFRGQDLVVVHVLVLSEVADVLVKVDGFHLKVEAQVVRVLEHKCLVLSAHDFHSDALQQLSPVVQGGHVLQESGEDGLNGLAAVLVVLVNLDQVVRYLVEGVVVDLGRRQLVELRLDDGRDAHKFADRLRMHLRLLHALDCLGFFRYEL